jgi:hypothetical protein
VERRLRAYLAAARGREWWRILGVGWRVDSAPEYTRRSNDRGGTGGRRRWLRRLSHSLGHFGQSRWFFFFIFYSLLFPFCHSLTQWPQHRPRFPFSESWSFPHEIVDSLS